MYIPKCKRCRLIKCVCTLLAAGENPKDIQVGHLALVCGYGDDPFWWEVIAVGEETITITNGCGEDFVIPRYDVYGVTFDSSVLM